MGTAQQLYRNVFLRLIRNPVKYRLYLLTRLPAAFFAGVRVKEVDEDHCIVGVPYKWFTKNPFRSTYFACLSMAAEMSSGVLAMVHVYGHQPPVSMLVVRMEAEFLKKATGLIRFSCSDGPAIKDAIYQAVVTDAPQTVMVRSTGVNEAGETIAVFNITWSFKTKSVSK